MDNFLTAMDFIEKLLNTPELTALDICDDTLDLLIEVAQFQNSVTEITLNTITS